MDLPCIRSLIMYKDTVAISFSHHFETYTLHSTFKSRVSLTLFTKEHTLVAETHPNTDMWRWIPIYKFKICDGNQVMLR